MILNDTDRRLISKLLEMASDTYSNHGCNDFNVAEEAGFTKKENARLREGLTNWSGDDDLSEDLDDTDHIDWMLMGYYADKLKNNGRT